MGGKKKLEVAAVETSVSAASRADAGSSRPTSAACSSSRSSATFCSTRAARASRPLKARWATSSGSTPDLRQGPQAEMYGLLDTLFMAFYAVGSTSVAC
ncbi:uncharacterized protein KRP23_12666 [Phytophthora ramorum]|uniref:uncharacterized protein n=1 Tax=Phytophthora ramorum TaxID=164328 RepID=UPI0030AB44DC|nr:hypothetical protein KRP23_12666 [Phytophthora ramorum]